MILVADSGSTKTDWALITQDKTTYTETIGFSPMFHSVDFIVQEILKNTILKEHANEVLEVFYYGTGCSSPERNAIVLKALQAVFKNSTPNVDHDIAGAVLATCEGKPGIACILGTGSNVVFFDGTEIKHFTSALGYILGDEASGAYFGKRLLADFINEDVPHEIFYYLKNELGLEKEIIYENVYKKSNANRYLGSFAKVLSLFKDDPYVINLLKKGFEEFIRIHIQKIPHFEKYPVHFVGSIAHVFESILSETLKNNHAQIGKIVKSPIHEMVKAYKDKCII